MKSPCYWLLSYLAAPSCVVSSTLALTLALTSCGTSRVQHEAGRLSMLEVPLAMPQKHLGALGDLRQQRVPSDPRPQHSIPPSLNPDPLSPGMSLNPDTTLNPRQLRRPETTLNPRQRLSPESGPKISEQQWKPAQHERAPASTKPQDPTKTMAKPASEDTLAHESALREHIPAYPHGPDPFATTGEVRKRMEDANIAFNTPKTMYLHETIGIQLILSIAQATDELKEKISGKGEKETATVPASPIMEARLTGPNFEITAITPEEQAISREDNTEWKWEVKPRASGTQNLHLTLNAIFTIDESETKWSMGSFDKIITVNVTASQQMTDFVGNHWQWLWTVIAAPLGLGLWNRKNGKKRKTRKN